MQDRKVIVKEMTMTKNPYLTAIEAFEVDQEKIIKPILLTAASAAQALLDRMRSNTIDAVKFRLSMGAQISEHDFFQLFAALDALSEEVHLCEQVGMNQTTMYYWREFKQAPEQAERQQILMSILGWVEKFPTTTGEQMIGQTVEDLAWSEAYPDMPEHMYD